ncbi:hypothetical protein ACLOJK_009125 [Asimina triloba]
MAKEMAKDKQSISIVVSDLLSFLNASATAFHAVDEAKRRLKEAGFEHVSEREDWKLEPGKKYFFTRNHSTIVAFAIGKRYVAGNGFHIVGAHTDSPCLKLKPVSKVAKGGYLEVGVQAYGGGLWHTWFDRDLTVAGRLMIRKGKDDSISYLHRLVRIDEPIMRIPTLAIHLDSAGVGVQVEAKQHMRIADCSAVCMKTALLFAELQKVVTENGPVEGGVDESTKKQEKENADAKKHHPILLQLLAEKACCEPDEICDFELQLCDMQPSLLGGATKEFALIDSTASETSLENETGVRMVALFDHEEVGSDSAQGAGSPVMLDALSRITSFFSSSESKDKHEDNHQPKLHGGLVIKHNANQRYATNAVTSFIFQEIARRHNLPVQDFVVRNDMGCGSTIGPILASGVGIRTVDVGAPQLSMHSIREMCGVDDIKHSYEHFKAYYEEFSELDAKISIDFNSPM